MITEAYEVLLVEDSQSDITLIKRQILKIAENANISAVTRFDQLETRLKDQLPHIIISDYKLPTCTGLEVLEVAQRVCPIVPFIFLTGALENEELAAETILSGADGFILKKHINNLSEKLLPHFERLKFKNLDLIASQNKMAKSHDLANKISEYLEEIRKENLLHREGIEKIQNSLSKFKDKL